jgi:hypothetical protein
MPRRFDGGEYKTDHRDQRPFILFWRVWNPPLTMGSSTTDNNFPIIRMAVPIQAREVPISRNQVFLFVRQFSTRFAKVVHRQFTWHVLLDSFVCQEWMERDESRSFPSSWISRLSSGTEKRCFNIDLLSLNSRMGFVSLGFDWTAGQPS